MDYDILIKDIVESICNNLNIKCGDVSKKEDVILMGNIPDNYYHILSEKYNVFSYEDHMELGDIVIITDFKIDLMSNIATLSGENKKAQYVIKMLLQGKKVYVFEDGIEYKKYKGTSPKSLYNEFLAYENKLKSFGINFIKCLSEIEIKSYKEEYLSNECVDVEDNKRSNFYIKNKKVISEGDLIKPYLDGKRTIVIDKKSIITPLAEDYIRIHNLIVKRV